MKNNLILFPTNSEHTLRAVLEKSVDSIIMVEQLQQVAFYSDANEYREYNLTSLSETNEQNFGNIDDIIIIFQTWKHDFNDRVFNVYLEYEQLNDERGYIFPIDNTVRVGLLLSIQKEETL